MCKEKFAHATKYAAMSLMLMDKKAEQLKWLYNVKSFELPGTDGEVMLFDETLRGDTNRVYYIFGDSGEESFTYQDCKNVFKNQPEENLVWMKDCGHFLMDEKPEETTKNVMLYIEDIDLKNSAI